MRRNHDYVLWHNLDAMFSRPYQPGDTLVRGWAGTIEVDDLVGATLDDNGTMALFDPMRVLRAGAAKVFAAHNRDERPDGFTAPSLSVGDVVQFGEVALSVDRRGFVRVDLDGGDLVVDVTYREMAAQRRP